MPRSPSRSATRAEAGAHVEGQLAADGVRPMSRAAALPAVERPAGRSLPVDHAEPGGQRAISGIRGPGCTWPDDSAQARELHHLRASGGRWMPIDDAGWAAVRMRRKTSERARDMATSPQIIRNHRAILLSCSAWPLERL